MIQVTELTLQYPNGKGIRDVSFQVEEGQILGYLGPNGAGKTTTIRCLLGYSRADSGSCFIRGLDCSRHAPKIQRFLGYLPGEIAFPDGMTGKQFLDFMAQMRGLRDRKRQKELEEMFEIDLSGRIRRYSKGMKQKVGIIAAFMHDPEVIILDEPTSGLDPLMQNRFTTLVNSEKKRGKTILMSSHIFEEVEKTCDQVVIIREGQVAMCGDIRTLEQSRQKLFLLTLRSGMEISGLEVLGAQVRRLSSEQYEIGIRADQVGEFLRFLAPLDVIALESVKQNLEDVFLHLYGGKEGTCESDVV